MQQTDSHPDINNETTKVKNEQPVEPENKRQRNKDNRKKGDKNMDRVLKTLNGLGSAEEKLTVLCKKYSELADENKFLQTSTKTVEKQLAVVVKHRDQLQAENTKFLLTRSRLENLCRELQKQNKEMKDETITKIREEEEKRKEVSGKFQSTLTEITSLMHQNSENNNKLRDENIEMQNKLKHLCEQYELREKQVDQMSKQMKLEAQLAEARMKKAELEMTAERELAEKERAQMKFQTAMLEEKCREHEKTEEALRAQISMYVDKYDDFQNVLARSNQVYSTFKGEMEKMSKKITRLEKETSSWKSKWENSHEALVRMADEKQQKDAEIAMITKQLKQMQKLCRTLQAERTALMQQLKVEGIIPQLPERRLSSERDPCPPSEKPTSPVEIVSNNNSEKPITSAQTDSISCNSEPEKAPAENVSTDVKNEVSAEPSELVSENEKKEDAVSIEKESLNKSTGDVGTVENITFETPLVNEKTEEEHNQNTIEEKDLNEEKVAVDAEKETVILPDVPPVAEPRKRNKEGRRRRK